MNLIFKDVLIFLNAMDFDRRPTGKKSHKERKYDYIDFETYQQALLITLLNKNCSFLIKKQRKQSVISCRMPILKSITIREEEIELAEVSETLCKNQLLEDYSKGINKQTAFRRFEKNRKVFIINMLYDISLEFGYFFESTLARKSSKTKRLDRIKKVFFNNKLLLSKQEIIDLGVLINNYLIQLVEKQKEVVIPKNDQFISSIFKQFIF